MVYKASHLVHVKYSRVQKSIENFVFRLKMAIFRRAGMKEGGLPLPLAFQYLILIKFGNDIFTGFKIASL